MKYLLLQFAEEKYWYELDDDGYVYRQIVLDEHNQIHVSCLEDCLAEGPINEEDLDGIIINLTKQEFDTLWQSVLKKYRKQWEGIKKRYPVGACVQGVNSYSYPQGTVIRGNDFIAIYTGDEPFCLNKLVQYKVKAYDDMDMWLVVG